jgi:hypothetical protein
MFFEIRQMFTLHDTLLLPRPLMRFAMESPEAYRNMNFTNYLTNGMSELNFFFVFFQGIHTLIACLRGTFRFIILTA